MIEVAEKLIRMLCFDIPCRARLQGNASIESDDGLGSAFHRSCDDVTISWIIGHQRNEALVPLDFGIGKVLVELCQ